MGEARLRSLQGKILERIHKEDYQPYDNFSQILARSLYQHGEDITLQELIKITGSTQTDFFNFNNMNEDEKEEFLYKVYKDIKTISSFPSINGTNQVYIEQIDSFEEIKGVSRKDVNENVDDPPLKISEEDIKRFLRKIIGEPFNQKDWGGERNDLYSSALRFDKKRIDAAFMLKGPSVGAKMTIADAGKNGTQIQKLFEASVDLYIIQFNARPTDRFVQYVKEQAQITKAKLFCIIDGADTARLLKAYGKLKKDC